MSRSKFSVGQEVVLFDSLACEFKKDVVFAVYYAPVPVEGVEPHLERGVKERLDAGEVEVREQYQLVRGGIVPSDRVFASEDECRAFYREFMGGEA